jgi:hypothetical protein
MEGVFGNGEDDDDPRVVDWERFETWVRSFLVEAISRSAGKRSSKARRFDRVKRDRTRRMETRAASRLKRSLSEDRFQLEASEV